MWIVVDIVGSVITPGMAKQEAVPARGKESGQSKIFSSFLPFFLALV